MKPVFSNIFSVLLNKSIENVSSMQGINLNFSNPAKLINFATHYFSSVKTEN